MYPCTPVGLAKIWDTWERDVGFQQNISIYQFLFSESFNGICRYELFLTAGHLTCLFLFTVMVPLAAMTILYVIIIVLYRRHVSIIFGFVQGRGSGLI